MKKYTGFIFAMLMGMMASAATYYTVSTNNGSSITWSLTPNGAPCNCGPNLGGGNSNFSDTLVIFHDVQVPNLELKSGALVVIKSGATFSGAWSWMRVRNGAKIQMEAGSTLEPNVNFELEGEVNGSGTIITNWNFKVKNTGVINLGASSDIQGARIESYGSISIIGDIVLSGPVDSEGLLIVDGDLSVGGSLNNTDSVSVSGDLTAQSLDVEHGLYVGGSANISNAFNSEGVVLIAGNLTAGSVDIKDSVNVAGSLSAGAVLLETVANVGGDLTASTNWDINGNISVEGNVTLSGGSSPFDASTTIKADSIFVNSTNIVVNNHVDVTFNANYMSVSGGNYNPQNHSSLTFNTKIYIQNFSLTVNNHASLTFSDSVWVMGGTINGKPNSFMQFGDALYLAVNLDTKGEVQFLGVVTFNSLAEIKGNPEITGCGILDFSTASPGQYDGNYDINGLNNITLSPVTFLGAVGNSSCASNTIWYYNGNWSATPSSTSCSEEAVILSDLNWNSSISVGKLKVNRGVRVNIKSGATITICADVVNDGEILVETGGTLIVQGI